jgi:hypothetical protein
MHMAGPCIDLLLLLQLPCSAVLSFVKVFASAPVEKLHGNWATVPGHVPGHQVDVYFYPFSFQFCNFIAAKTCCLSAPCQPTALS